MKLIARPETQWSFLMPTLAEAITDRRATHAIVDRGYRGRKWIGSTEVPVPGRPRDGQSRLTQTRMRKRFRRRVAIEPVISHLKADIRLTRCYFKEASSAIRST